MLETLRKKTLKSTIISSTIMIIIGIAMLVFQGKQAIYTIIGYADFASLEPGEIKNQIVDVKLDTNFGAYVETYETKSGSNRRTTVNVSYVILTGDENSTEYCFMGIKVPASFVDSMDEMAELNYNGYYADEPLYLSGEIRKIDAEDYRYFKSYFTSAGWTEEEFEQATIPYYIFVYHNKLLYSAMGLLVAGAGLALIIWAIIRIVRASKGALLKKLQKDFADAGVSEATAEADFNSARSLTKNGSFKIGRLFIFNMTSTVPRAIPASKVSWAYQNTVTHRRNGVKTGTTYNVVIFVESEKPYSLTLAMPNEATVQEILTELNVKFPWVITGYSEELRSMYNKNRSQFLGLRYNTVDHVAVDPAAAGMNSGAIPSGDNA